MEHIENRQIELDNCRFAKAILALIIVFYHSIIFWGGDWFTKNPVFQAGELSVLAQWMNSFHIFAFALISGYLYFFQKEERGKYKQFLPFALTKAKRLLVPYFFVALAWALPAKVFLQKSDLFGALFGYLLGTSASHLWFLLMLFNVFVFVWPFSPIIKKSDLLSVLIAGGFYLMSMLGPKIIPNYFQVWTSCRYVTFFLIGYKIRQHGSEMLMCIPSWIMLACNIVLFWLNRICAGSDFLGAGILTIGTGVACNVVGAIMVFAILQKIAPKKPCVVGKFVDEISKKSMTIYLFHQQIIYLFILLFNGVLHPYLNAAVNFIGSLTLSVVIAHILSQFRVTRFLIGEK